jgi:3-hydroxyacyl-CoA dehydrogenase
MAISREPEPINKQPVSKVSEKKLQEFINGGGTPTKKGISETTDNATKSIKLIMTAEEMEAIKQLRDKRQAPRSRKISISVHDWVIEAVQEKIERENRKYARV